MEKSDTFLSVLRALDRAGALSHFVLVGSWCLDVYRKQFGNPVTIPVTRTLDADLLIPRRVPRSFKIDVVAVMEEIGFVTQTDYPRGFQRFVHPNLNVEFLTAAGAKASASVHSFPSINLVAQELRYMNIPLSYRMTVQYGGLELSVPEPEAFTLHKLLVADLRKDPEKKRKDLEAAVGMLQFIQEDDSRLERIRKIYSEFPPGWRKKVDRGLEATTSFVSVDLAAE